MVVQLETRPMESSAFAAMECWLDGFDLDAVDSALDRGDLETVRRLLDISRPAWNLLLDGL